MKRRKTKGRYVKRRATKPRRLPGRRFAGRLQPVARDYSPVVVVKFHDHVTLPYDARVERELDAMRDGAWRRLKDKFRGISIQPMFTSVPPGRIRELSAEAQRIKPGYKGPNYLTYFLVTLPAGVDDRNLIRALSAWRLVQTAYLELPVKEAHDNSTSSRSGLDPRMVNQGYLEAAPTGIDAIYAWGLPGGDGAGQNFIDIERGWNLGHEDLAPHNPQLLYGTPRALSRAHGTSVLGVACAAMNPVGCRGIAHKVASVNVVSSYGAGNTVANAILKANALLQAGDVLLLEVERLNFATGIYVPTEFQQADFHEIENATTRGIVVIEAAANGGQFLDTVPDVSGSLVFAKRARDSGAILVGAATSSASHAPYGSNFGSRVNCYAWGQNVDAPTSTGAADFTSYTENFDGTSSAAAIIAGAALVVQGIAFASCGKRLDSFQMRGMLSDPATGTGSKNGVADGIGSMPNLRAIIDSGAIGRFCAQTPLP